MLLRAGTLLSLFGAIAIALLPGGLLPRKSGPCGKDLCLCKPLAQMDIPKSEEPCSACPCEKSSAPQAPVARWIWVKNAQLNAPSENITFSTVFAQLELPSRFEFVVHGMRSMEGPMISDQLAYDSLVQSIDSPPPKRPLLERVS